MCSMYVIYCNSRFAYTTKPTKNFQNIIEIFSTLNDVYIYKNFFCVV